MRRIYLIDCPGVVYPSAESDTEKVLKGVVRVELVNNPEDYINSVLQRVKKDYIKKTYKIGEWTDAVDFLEKMARRSGKLLKKGEPDITSVAKMVLNDWQRGKLPFYCIPPGYEQPLLQENKLADESGIGVVQDLRKIKVGLSYEGEDLKELEPIKDLDKVVTEYSEDKSENDSLLEESINTNISNLNGTSNSEMTNDEKQNSEENITDTDSDVSFYSDMEEENKEYAIATSGTFEVEDLTKTKNKIKSNKSSNEKTVKNLTSKKRRAIERSQKRKKIGSNFYEVANVKNRNRNKKKPNIG